MLAPTGSDHLHGNGYFMGGAGQTGWRNVGEAFSHPLDKDQTVERFERDGTLEGIDQLFPGLSCGGVLSEVQQIHRLQRSQGKGSLCVQRFPVTLQQAVQGDGSFFQPIEPYPELRFSHPAEHPDLDRILQQRVLFLQQEQVPAIENLAQFYVGGALGMHTRAKHQKRQKEEHWP